MSHTNAGFNLFTFANSDYDSSSASVAFSVAFYNDGGTYKWRFGRHSAGTWAYIYRPEITTGAWHYVEVKVDNIGSGSHEFPVDGASQGTLTGTFDRGDVRYFGAGGGGSGSESYTAYVDSFAISTTGRIGESCCMD